MQFFFRWLLLHFILFYFSFIFHSFFYSYALFNTMKQSLCAHFNNKINILTLIFSLKKIGHFPRKTVCVCQLCAPYKKKRIFENCRDDEIKTEKKRCQQQHNRLRLIISFQKKYFDH